MSSGVSVAEVAQRMGLSVATVKRMCADGRLAARKVGRTWVVGESATAAIAPFPETRDMLRAKLATKTVALEMLERRHRLLRERYRLTCERFHAGAGTAHLLAKIDEQIATIDLKTEEIRHLMAHHEQYHPGPCQHPEGRMS